MNYVKSAIFDYSGLLDAKTFAANNTNGEKQQQQHPDLVNDEEINFFSLLQSLSIAYFNEGVENEHLKDYEFALQSYERSKAFARQVFDHSGGVNNAMLLNAGKSLEEVQQKLFEIKN